LSAQAADSGIDVRIQLDSLGFQKPLPVFVTGYSGEVDRVLRFDLSFMGFELVKDRNAARYIIQKNNAAGIGAQVNDPLANKIPYNKAFTGPSPRHQVHALADDLSQTFTKLPGIAQTRVGFVAQAAGYGVGEIYVADFDGFNAAPVTRDGVIVHTPAWAGKNALLYMSHKLANKADILWHDLGTGTRKPFAKFPAQNVSPAVSRDGKRVALILSKSGNPDLYVCDIDGGNLKQLTKGKDSVSSPCWSPDGSKICFSSRVSGISSLYTISANGGSQTRLSVGSTPTEPDWSPDGKYIVCTTQSRSGFQITVLPMEGPSRGVPTTLAAGEDPVWAPNSRAVMFVRSVNYRHVLALLDVPSRMVKDITAISGSASEPSWAR
ncbi:MAG TPA: DPP IV N-terminal domain-containing protein, partial [Candidatus Acidoferrum sp.]|nr:DPP IV N-terminal domain-containing protein [Candidatus Acidoferrum sp.]